MSKWKSVNIGNSGLFIADGNYSAKYPNSKEFISSGVPFIRANNFKNKTIIDDELYFISPEKHSQITKGHLKINDVLITTRGNIGELAIVPKRHENSNINAQIVLLRCNDEWDPLFLLYILSSSIVKEQLPNLTTGTALKQLPVKNLKKIILPLPPLPEQQKIANILDAADALRQNDKALIAKYDELTQALFLDMFGDPVSNPKGWEKVSLSEYGSFKNGLNFNNTESGVSIKYLGVGDFKSKSRIDDVESLSNIELNSLPNDGYLLNDGDLVFVRSNGNRALVGRCVEVYPKNNKLTFSGFCIRYRINSHLVKPTYLSQLFRNKSFKNLMLESGQGANIQNINQQILSSIDVPLPSLTLQEKFVNSIQAIEEQKKIAQMTLSKSEELFNGLLQKAFKGELE